MNASRRSCALLFLVALGSILAFVNCGAIPSPTSLAEQASAQEPARSLDSTNPQSQSASLPTVASTMVAIPESRLTTLDVISEQRTPAVVAGQIPVATPVGAVARPKQLGISIANPIDGKVALIRDYSLIIIEETKVRQAFTVPIGGLLKDPAWSPDGRTLAFAYAPPRGAPQKGAAIVDMLLTSDIMLVDQDGTNPRICVAHDLPGAILESPRWAPDGKSVYYSYYAPTYKGEELIQETMEVRIVEIAGGKSASVFANASSPAPSADGKLLAFIAEDASNGPSLRIMAVAGGAARVVVGSDDFVTITAPRFSPDGSAILFGAVAMPSVPAPTPRAEWHDPFRSLFAYLEPSLAEAHGLPWELYSVAVSGGPARRLTNVADDTLSGAWSVDGRRVLAYGAGGLYLVDPGSGKTDVLNTDGSHGGMDWLTQK